MFYVKSGDKKITLRENNVFTQCPICGKEHAVNIAEIFRGGFANLHGPSILCQECADDHIRVTPEKK